MVTAAVVAGALMLTGLPVGPAGAEPGVPADWVQAEQEWKPLPHDVVGAVGGAPDDRVAGGGLLEVAAVSAGTLEVDGPDDAGTWSGQGASPVTVTGAAAATVEVRSETDAMPVAADVVVELDGAPADDAVTVSVDVSGLPAGRQGRASVVEVSGCSGSGDAENGCDAAPSAVDASLSADGDTLSFRVSNLEPAMSRTFAVTSSAEGEDGSFSAQPLGASSTWAVGGSTGDFSWSYPFQVPDVSLGGGFSPGLSLDYSSGSVDGRIASTNNQVGPIGVGWALEPGFIERRFKPCADGQTTGKTGDLCWGGDELFLSFGAHSAELVRDDATGVFRLRNDDGTRVERLTGAPNGAFEGEYWKVTTADGQAAFFGREALPGRTSQALTGSTWTVPVFGQKAGDRCYSSSGFGSSKCVQAWRWNLDYIEDPLGHAAAFYYDKELNHYAANLGKSREQYVRGGTVQRVEYGLRNVAGSVYGSPAAAEIAFTTNERCIPTDGFDCAEAKFTSANAQYWPDTPQYLACAASGTCVNYSPTFWSRKRVTKIASKVRTAAGTMQVRDEYALTQTFPTTGEPGLWLDSITHTGYSASGQAMKEHPVVFGGELLANRVTGYNQFHSMMLWRLASITDEHGARTTITYSKPECTATNVPDGKNLSGNTKRCFPVWWTKPSHKEPSLDFFHKYVVDKVSVTDPQAVSPTQVTEYAYVGAPAWHFDDNALVKEKERTWGQYRGYRQVDTRTGDPGSKVSGVADVQTLTRSFYHQGMDGDRLSAGGTRSVSLQNSLGESLPDKDHLAGAAFEVQEFNGASAATPASRAFTYYDTYATSAKRARPGLSTLEAHVVGVSKERSITATAAGGSLESATVYTRDAHGRELTASVTGTNAPSSCATTRYATNTTRNILDAVAEQALYAGTCPSTGAPTGAKLRASRTFYDGSSTIGALPGPGLPTRSDTAITTSEWAKSTARYDALGRTTASTVFTSPTDATGRTTTTSYSPASGPVTTVTVTNPLGHKATTVHDIDGQVVKTTDALGRVSEATYDPLGRITAVWQPGFPRSGPANELYSYTVSTTKPDTFTTKTLTSLDGGPKYATNVDLYDAFGQLVQTQTDAIGGARIVNDTFYDSHGWPVKANNHWFTTGTPSGQLVTTLEAGVDSRTVTRYDGLGRATLSIAYRGNTETRRTTTIHGGDRTTVIPPKGGVATTSVVDGLGKLRIR